MNESYIKLKIEKDHCVQSAAKKEYDRMLRNFMTADSIHEPEDKYKLELLRDFLENTDFAALRSSNECFSGIKDAACMITRNPEGKPYVILLDL